jgi:hypothetical protein
VSDERAEHPENVARAGEGRGLVPGRALAPGEAVRGLTKGAEGASGVRARHQATASPGAEASPLPPSPAAPRAEPATKEKRAPNSDPRSPTYRRRRNSRKLNKKLINTTCPPTHIAATPGTASRNVCCASSAPNPARYHTRSV